MNDDHAGVLFNARGFISTCAQYVKPVLREQNIKLMEQDFEILKQAMEINPNLKMSEIAPELARA